MGRPTLLHHSNSASRHYQFLDINLANSASSFSSSFTTTLLQQPQPSIRPAPRGELSTRVQLQKQRLQEHQQNQHGSHLVTKTIPGLRSSAAFFESLRTNLRLHADPPPSPISTPPSMQSSWTSLPPPSPLSMPLTPVDSVMDPLEHTPSKSSKTIPLTPLSPSPNDPLAGVPELHTYIATSEDDQIDALRLTADSVAQMRQTANQALLFHPLNLAVIVAILALAMRYLHESGYDKMAVATTCSGLIMGYLLLARWMTQDYLSAAEAIDFTWLGDADVFVTKFGEEIIGTAIVEWVSGESAKQRRKRAWRGEIRAWTVRMRYRGKGVGTALLEDVLKEGKRKGAEGIEFAMDHANSKAVLPAFYNGVFRKRDIKARELLADLVQSVPRGKRK